MIFERIYVNGSSLSCGGSLEPRTESYVYYTEKMGYPKWEDEKEKSYGNLLGRILNMPVINDSKQGGGLDRLIRKTFDYIDTLSEKEVNSTLFLFDIPLQPNRMEIYSKEFSDYLVVSVYNKKYKRQVESKTVDSKISFSRAYKKESLDLSYDQYIKHDKIINQIVEKYYDFEVELKRMIRQLILFYNFLDGKKIYYNIDLNDSLFTASGFKRDDLVLYRNNYSQIDNPRKIEMKTIWDLSVTNKWRICDEIKGNDDSHLGLIGNLSYAKFIEEKIKEKGFI